jgi:hypothetical protein
LTSEFDFERLAMFYILSGNEDIWRKGIDNLYDFKRNCITPKQSKKIDLCTSSRALVNLAFHLYNGYGKDTLTDTFYSLDGKNKLLAFNAIEIRYFGLK